MSGGESCRERQIYELEALKSIFGDELHDLKKNKTKKKWQPMDIIITLTPQKGMSGPAEVYAQIDLHVTCSEKYPDEAPHIQLSNSRGLSNQQIAALESELKILMDNLLGEVMIFELAQHVQKFLHEHNKPGCSSFYEEMLQRQQKMAEKMEYEMQKKKLEENKQRQELQDEIQKRQAALKAELRNSREPLRLETESLPQSIPSSPQERNRAAHFRHRYKSTSDSFDNCFCENRGIKLLHFHGTKGERKIHRIQYLGQNQRGSTVYAGVDLSTGDLFAVTEWILKYEPNENSEESNLQYFMKQIANIEQEFNLLYKLHHPNLVHYVHMNHTREENNLVIHILEEFVIGITCAKYLHEQKPLDVDSIRSIAKETLSALKFLHDNNVVHKDLRDTSVHITQSGIQISDYSLDKRMSELYRATCLNVTEDEFPSTQGRGGKKFDIYRFGLLMLSLLKGCDMMEKNVNLDLNIPADLRDFLSKCLISEERTRWSAEQLLHHSFIKTPIDHGASPPRLNMDEEQDEPETPDANINFMLPAVSGPSRLQKDFEILKWLGKGAFGSVVKVRHEFDGRIYAIKRIELNPKKRQLNRKIMREVKLLSRLSHENVVRYYTSWIESATVDETWQNQTITSTATTPSTKEVDEKLQNFSISERLGSEQIENMAPPIRNNSKPSAALSTDSEEDNSSSDSDSDEENWAFLNTRSSESSDSIQFEEDEMQQNSESLRESRDATDTADETIHAVKEVQFMYIQMEFCEKSTLRTAIDNSLYKDEDRMWRLFREVVEGLAHIHQKGMIHRDLKPVNVFIDSNDHVKIGDFGLATTNILSTVTPSTDIEVPVLEKGTSNSYFDELGSMTGRVGTALYVAPELNTKKDKAIYNQKVDIYSLGIIFFEMSYGPLSTGMERVKVLLNLRSKEIVLPSDMEESMQNKAHLLRWLVNHDPSQRPTAQELLVSGHIPATQLEELKETVRHTLSNRQSRAYKHLIDSCLSQEVTPADDVTYDMNIPTRGVRNSHTPRIQLLQESVRSRIIKVFQKHGATALTTPLFMPKTNQLYNLADSCVWQMTSSGIVVSLPHDLRAPFARYVVWNNIQHIRRYAIERVYREKKVHGFLPRELYQCAFDIVSPKANNLMTEAELIFIVWEICNEIPQMKDKNFTVRLNHTSLLQAIFMHCGIEKEKYEDIYKILCDARDGKYSKFQVQTHFTSLCLTDQAMETLFILFEAESSIEHIANVLKPITRRRGEASILVKEGLQDIETVISNIQTLDMKWPITVSPLMVHNTQQHSGMIFQINLNEQSNKLTRRHKRGEHDVIAFGGRYDKLLMSFRQILERTGMDNSKGGKSYGAGISVSLDKLLCTIDKSESEVHEEEKYDDGIDVAVFCEEGQRETELAVVFKKLWSLGLKVTSVELPSIMEILEYCRENLIKNVVALRNSERGSVMIYSWDSWDRYQDRKISLQDFLDNKYKLLDNALPALNRSESKTTANNDSKQTTANVNFILVDRDKLSGSGRRQFKISILAQMQSTLQRIWNKVPVEVIAVFLEKAVLRKICNGLEIDEEEQEFQRSIQEIIDEHPRHKKIIVDICEEMRRFRSEKQRPVLALYSLQDSRYFLIL